MYLNKVLLVDIDKHSLKMFSKIANIFYTPHKFYRPSMAWCAVDFTGRFKKYTYSIHNGLTANYDTKETSCGQLQDITIDFSSDQLSSDTSFPKDLATQADESLSKVIQSSMKLELEILKMMEQLFIMIKWIKAYNDRMHEWNRFGSISLHLMDAKRVYAKLKYLLMNYVPYHKFDSYEKMFEDENKMREVMYKFSFAPI